MQRLFRYYGRYQSLRGGLSSLPAWARCIVALAAIPGILLLALSILAALVSIAVLSLLTVPVYMLVAWAVPPRRPPQYVQATVESVRDAEPDAPAPETPSPADSRPRRQIDVRIIE